MTGNPILVTRPEEPGRGLVATLVACGADAFWLPAFDLKPAPKPLVVANTLAHLSTYDLAVFVSPATVRATAAVLREPWPARTVIGAVGQATAQAVRAELRPSSAVRIIAPKADDEGGSEALLRALDVAGIEPARVLILRAAVGRDWLRERLGERDVHVESLAVYDRQTHALSDAERDWLQARSGPLDGVFSSSEAVDAVRAMLAASAAWDAMRNGRAVASHTRIAQRLVRAGFADVRVCGLRAEEILAALRRDGVSQ
jgi:uroporphyrinogen-III synthase